MPGKRQFEEQLAALDAVRTQSPESAATPLRKALAHRNNFIVAKAADIVRQFQLAGLTPELLTAFDRFLLPSDKDDPIKSDPQCWAKNAIAKTLAAFEYQEPEPFLRGIKHIQLEPVWGGSSDSAGVLRSTCAFALVQCRGVPEPELLRHLIDLLGDKEKSVRAEAARAIEQVGSTSAVLLLRLKAIAGDKEAEVLGGGYSGILHIEGAKAIPWVARFLDSADDAAAEAALAIAETRTSEAFEVLRDHLSPLADPWFASAMLSAISLTRQEAATEFLVEQVQQNSHHAEAAIEAILRSAPSPELTKRVEKLVAGHPRLLRVFNANREQPS